MTGAVAASFACEPELELAALLERVQAAGTLHGPVEARADEIYLDTRADELAAAGLSVRAREHAGVRTIELVVVPIDPEMMPEPPRLERAVARGEDVGAAVRSWVLERFGLTLSQAPREVLSLVIARRRWACAVGDVVIELALDEISGAEPHGRRARLRELVVDAPQASTDPKSREAIAMRRVLAILERAPGLRKLRQSRFERTREALGLGELRYGAKPTPLAADDLLAVAARRVVVAWWATATAHLPGVRVGLDPEHVHKLRVAMRRLRTALRLFDDAFEPGPLAALRDRLRTLGRALGEVRDLDVQREALGHWRERFSAIDEPAWQDITARIDRQRVMARKDALVLLDARAWAEVDAEVERCVAPDNRGLRHTIGAVAVELVRKRTDRCSRALERAREGDAKEAHALRIEVKNLRYSIDFLGDALPAVQDVAASLAALQDALGRVQDDVQTSVLAQTLATMVPPPTSATALALGVLIGYGRARADDASIAAREAVAKHGFEESLAELDALGRDGEATRPRHGRRG